jgi:putative ABC transport system permease protein
MLGKLLDDILTDPVTLVAALIGVLVVIAGCAGALFGGRLFLLGVKNLRRNLLRTVLTALATLVLVFMVTIIWTVINGIERLTVEKSRDFKAIITERWQVPSQMPGTYAGYLDPESPAFLPELRDEKGNPLYGPDDFMSWSFYAGTLNPKKNTPADIMFVLAAEPKHIIPMMDDMEDYDPKLVKALQDHPQGCLLGPEKLEMINKRVGDTITLSGLSFPLNFKDLDVELTIVGTLPMGRYAQIGIMRLDYFNRMFDAYRHKRGVDHPLSERRLNYLWLRVSDHERFDVIGEKIENSLYFQNRPVKVETQSSGTSAFLDGFRDLLAVLKWVLVPGMLIVMALVMANAISITVRERRTEMAVMKVLGYRPNQIMLLILGEALLVGACSGLASTLLTYGLMNQLWGGIPFRVAFLPVFRIPEASILWGLAIGTTTALLGSIVPAWTAREVKVSEVFSKVT